MPHVHLILNTNKQTGGKSIYGGKFEDENFKLKHTGPGMAAFAIMCENSFAAVLTRAVSTVRITQCAYLFFMCYKSEQVHCQWQTRGRIATGHNSSSPRRRQTGWVCAGGRDRLLSIIALINSWPPPMTDNKHVVFGKVVQGLDVVRAVEAVGSQSGKTSQKVGYLIHAHAHGNARTCESTSFCLSTVALHY